MAFDAPPPPPVAAEVRTVEELGIGPSRVRTAGQRIVEVASIVLRRYRSGDRRPSYRNVRFENASRTSRCQQNVRELVEATMYGEERTWREASCCARSTQIGLHLAAKRGLYIEMVDIDDVQPGDIIYIGGGSSSCSECGRTCGHVMVYTKKDDGNLLMWQNTSFERRALCEIPLRKEQSERFLSAYRFEDRNKQKRAPPLWDGRMASIGEANRRTDVLSSILPNLDLIGKLVWRNPLGALGVEMFPKS